MKIYLSRGANLFSLIFSIVMMGIGAVTDLYGVWLCIMGIVGIILSVQSLRNRKVIIELLEDCIRIPINKQEATIMWKELERAERKIAPGWSDEPDSYIFLYLKGVEKPLIAGLPDLSIDEDDQYR